MSDTINIKWSLSIGLANAVIGDVEVFDRDDWESMTDDQKEEAMKEIVFDRVDWYFHEEGES